jgi:hypothetical protein
MAITRNTDLRASPYFLSFSTWNVRTRHGSASFFSGPFTFPRPVDDCPLEALDINVQAQSESRLKPAIIEAVTFRGLER